MLLPVGVTGKAYAAGEPFGFTVSRVAARAGLVIGFGVEPRESG